MATTPGLHMATLQLQRGQTSKEQGTQNQNRHGSDHCPRAASRVTKTEEDENSCKLLEGAEFQSCVRPEVRASWRVVDTGVTQLTMLSEDKCGSNVENEIGTRSTRPEASGF